MEADLPAQAVGVAKAAGGHRSGVVLVAGVGPRKDQEEEDQVVEEAALSPKCFSMCQSLTGALQWRLAMMCTMEAVLLEFVLKLVPGMAPTHLNSDNPKCEHPWAQVLVEGVVAAQPLTSSGQLAQAALHSNLAGLVEPLAGCPHRLPCPLVLAWPNSKTRPWLVARGIVSRYCRLPSLCAASTQSG